MHAFFHAAAHFFSHFAAIKWQFLALAVGTHMVKSAAVSRAWFNIVRSSYPNAKPRWRDLYGAYIAGVGVNAIIPARVGDLAKLYIAKRRVRGSSYITLASTQVALTVFDLVAAGSLVVWALAAGVLPGLDVLPDLPDAGWFLQHYKLWLNISFGVLFGLVLLLIVAARRIEDFWARVRQGFVVFGDKAAYLRGVAFWQAMDWTLRFVTIYFFLRAFSLPGTFHNALLVQVVQSVNTIFPVTPGGAGTEQGLIVYVLGGQASQSEILAFAVGMKVTTLVVNLAVGFGAIGIMLRTFRWRKAAEADREAEAESPA